MIYIYGLIARKAQVKGIRYIGLTNNPDYRLISHRDPSESTGKALWVKDLLLSGDTIDMVILDKADTREEAHKLEASWIKFGEARGWELTNSIRPSGDCLSLPIVSLDSALHQIVDARIGNLFEASMRTQDSISKLGQELLILNQIVGRVLSEIDSPRKMRTENFDLPNRRKRFGALYCVFMIATILLFTSFGMGAYANAVGSNEIRSWGFALVLLSTALYMPIAIYHLYEVFISAIKIIRRSNGATKASATNHMVSPVAACD